MYLKTILVGDPFISSLVVQIPKCHNVQLVNRAATLRETFCELFEGEKIKIRKKKSLDLMMESVGNVTHTAS